METCGVGFEIASGKNPVAKWIVVECNHVNHLSTAGASGIGIGCKYFDSDLSMQGVQVFNGAMVGMGAKIDEVDICRFWVGGFPGAICLYLAFHAVFDFLSCLFPELDIHPNRQAVFAYIPFSGVGAGAGFFLDIDTIFTEWVAS